MKKILDYFHLGKIGLPELVIAMYPILIGYVYGVLYVGLLTVALVDVFYLSKKKRRHFNIKAFYIVATYILIHEFILWIFMGFNPPYMLNNTLQRAFTLFSIIIISFNVNYEKLINSFYWVAAVCIGGLIYQYLIIVSGGTVSPIRLPFLAPLEAGSRFDEIVIRPTSFFFEPGNFASYMLIPLFIALQEKKIVSVIILTLMMFLSTSSNGIFFALGLLLIFALTSKGLKIWHKVLFLAVGVGLVYTLLTSELFEQGINKIENTDLAENPRTANGIKYVSSLPPETFILGIPSANPTDYYMEHKSYFSGADLDIRTGEAIYITTIWLVIIKYGIIGLVLFLWMYFSYYKRAKSILPYIAILGVALFTQSSFIEIMQFVFMGAYINYYGNESKNIKLVK